MARCVSIPHKHSTWLCSLPRWIPNNDSMLLIVAICLSIMRILYEQFDTSIENIWREKKIIIITYCAYIIVHFPPLSCCCLCLHFASSGIGCRFNIAKFVVANLGNMHTQRQMRVFAFKMQEENSHTAFVFVLFLILFFFFCQFQHGQELFRLIGTEWHENIDCQIANWAMFAVFKYPLT